MKKICVLSAMILAACGKGDDNGAWKNYRCGKGDAAITVKARFFEGGAQIETNDKKYSLKQAVSADGARYAAKDVEFWTKGADRAMFTARGKTTACVVK